MILTELLRPEWFPEERGVWKKTLPGEKPDIDVGLIRHKKGSYTLDVGNPNGSLFRIELIEDNGTVTGIRENEFNAWVKSKDNIYLLRYRLDDPQSPDIAYLREIEVSPPYPGGKYTPAADSDTLRQGFEEKGYPSKVNMADLLTSYLHSRGVVCQDGVFTSIIMTAELARSSPLALKAPAAAEAPLAT